MSGRPTAPAVAKRLRDGQQRILAAMCGGDPAYARPSRDAGSTTGPRRPRRRRKRRCCSTPMHAWMHRALTARVVAVSVVGVGLDIVSIPEFAEQWKQPGTRFAEAFTAGERQDARSGTGGPERHLAARWAAKAVIKACR